MVFLREVQRGIGPLRTWEVTLAAASLDAQRTKKCYLVNPMVGHSELLGVARGIAKTIINNQNNLVLKFKAIIIDGYKLMLGEVLKLEQVYLIFSIMKCYLHIYNCTNNLGL